MFFFNSRVRASVSPSPAPLPFSWPFSMEEDLEYPFQRRKFNWRFSTLSLAGFPSIIGIIFIFPGDEPTFLRPKESKKFHEKFFSQGFSHPLFSRAIEKFVPLWKYEGHLIETTWFETGPMILKYLFVSTRSTRAIIYLLLDGNIHRGIIDSGGVYATRFESRTTTTTTITTPWPVHSLRRSSTRPRYRATISPSGRRFQKRKLDCFRE